MKILFFCASLDAGRDGVGDYTRLLADECSRRGHECAIIALHDPAVASATSAFHGRVHLLRLPADTAWSTRLESTRRYQRGFAPDWVSWQLVAYGFHPRGLVPPSLWRGVENLRGPRCHVMMHELWLGLEAGSDWRARLTGWLQRRGVLRLLAALRPDCLQTSNRSYRQVLCAAGFRAGVLGLFGNVPVPTGGIIETGLLERWLPAAVEAGGRPPLIGVTFGTLHPQWRPAATIDWMIVTAGRFGRTPMLLAIGRTGSALSLLDAFTERRVRVGVTGELAPQTVSDLFRLVDFGIAPHPWALIGKSGAAAAMLDHGLPVLVPRDDWHLRRAPALPTAPADPLLARLATLDAGRTDRWLAARRAPHSSLPRIADDFLGHLERQPLSSPAIPSLP